MIEAKELTKVFPGIVAVENVSFQIGQGEIVGFLGPNGAGKTTSMRILSCFLPPTSGSATVAGFDCLSNSQKVRERIGYLPERNPLYEEMRVDEYLRFRATLKGLSGKSRKDRMGEAIDRCGLSDRKTQIIQTLSHGYRQRVGLADAILHNPEVLILDEPTLGLDPNQIREVRSLIQDLGKERTVLLSSHILPEVEKICSRVLILNQGKLVAEGTPAQISEKLMKTGRLRLHLRGEGKGMKEAVDQLSSVSHTIWTHKEQEQTFLIDPKNEGAGRDLLSLCSEKGWEVVEFGPERLTLEDVFVEVTRGEGK